MELATGRVVKESSTGPGDRGSEAGRYGSSRSEGEKSGGGGARDYARDGGGGRSSDRDRDRDRRGGGGDKQQYRRKGSAESRGGSGSTRHYGDSRNDKAYRYTSHRDRSSRWELCSSFLPRFFFHHPSPCVHFGESTFLARGVGGKGAP